MGHSSRRSRGRLTTRNKKIKKKDIAEYLANKAQKKAIKAAKKIASENASGYTNDSNPFGDSNLNERFVWRKKIEQDVTGGGVPLCVLSVKAQKKRQQERMAEIEKVKKRRVERAIEKAQHEEEMALLARERAQAEVQDWEKKEEQFQFDQSKVRSRIRLREGRMKPIDVLSKHLEPSDEFDIEIEEPYMVFKGLTVKEMEELQEDIIMYLDSDRGTPTRIRYWEALGVVCDWELAEARKKEALHRARVRGDQPPVDIERGLHSSVEADVKKLLEGKSFAALEVLHSQIESQMRLGKAKVVEYWEAVLKHICIYKAKACLKEIHIKVLRDHLKRLERPDESSNKDMVRDKSASCKVGREFDHALEGDRVSEEIPSDEQLANEEEEAGSFSPELMHDDGDEEAADPEEDMALLEMNRVQVVEQQLQRTMALQPLENNFEACAMKAMGAMDNDGEAFGNSDEVIVDSKVYWWHDKYRPRKPKYFNRVHTGYEWNQYNRMHYDHDNPPPKTVQGYKFNIFYPDLVDKRKVPVYTFEKDGKSAETCIIRFHAGPPYEDIAFRIANKDWEYSHQKGFKCTFERGILHVYFNCKRYRYRR